MPSALDSPATPAALAPALATETGFEVVRQKVWLDINPLSASRSVTGRTEISVIPGSQDARLLKLNCRQAQITRLSTSLGKAPSVAYNDPYQKATLPGQTTANQWHMLQDRVFGEKTGEKEGEKVRQVAEPELHVTFGKARYPEVRTDDAFAAAHSSSGLHDLPLTHVTEFTIFIEFKIERVRDGLQFVGCDPEDLRYPHVFTHGYAGSAASCLFPCIDNGAMRHEWEIVIKTPKTIGDALATSGRLSEVGLRFSEEDKARDLSVVCSGELTDEIADKQDSSKKETSFRIENAVLAQHIGFAIGPFESVNLSIFRESGEDDKLGKSAIPIHGFCLPGRAEELRNTCFPLAKAIDFCVQTFNQYPFKSYRVAFVDDMVDDGKNCAALSLCSNRLLFGEDILEPMHRVTRYLAYCVASQWFGVNIVPSQPKDTWVTVGLAYYMADSFMKKLAGANEYRYFQKVQADSVYDMDVRRPCLLEVGANLWFDPSQMEFLALKAAMVMFILDRRLLKSNGTVSLSRIIFKICLQNSFGDLLNGAIDTERFMRACEKHGHLKLESFFTQWVEGAGCPLFEITQRFNKKRLVVEMSIKQTQHEASSKLEDVIRPDDFIREMREEDNEIYAPEPQHVFRGPMTIRIHEADGTPYEHIVEIKDMITRLEIPYNTKYKRLKRTRRNKEKLAQSGGNDDEAQSGLYMLGDNLQSEEDAREWQLAEFSKEDEDRMNSESFEWIRMDADFEWICRRKFGMQHYMYLSQLQQDRDVVAQLESIVYFAAGKPNRLISTFLVRTLMDRRYHYGVRSLAAKALKVHAKDEVGWIGWIHLKKAFQTLFSLPNGMIKPNDFSNRALHYIQCAIVESIGGIRDNSGRAPYDVRKFLLEILRFNDNSVNDYSDAHFLQAVMRALGSAVASAPPLESDIMDTDLENADDIVFFNTCLEEIDRHRRLDEWLPSYHNVLSIEGLNAKSELMRAGRISRDPREFLRYTQVTSNGDVRVAAFDHLLDLGFGSDPRIVQWFLYNLGSDSSAHVRKGLMTLFGKWLGRVATGQIKQYETLENVGDGLLVETDTVEASKELDEARKKTAEGALAALKQELGNDEILKRAIWETISSPVLTMFELGILLEVCGWLYDPESRMLLTLKYPRYWRVRSEGTKTLSDGSQSHMMVFKQTDRVRTKPIVRWQPPISDTITVGPKLTLKRKSSTFQQETMPAPKTKVQKKNSMSNGHASSPPPAEDKKRQILKLKLGPGVPQSPVQPSGAQTPGGGPLKLKFKLNASGAGR